MRDFREQGPFEMQDKSDENRLETPFMVGYRTGMSSTGVIARKLGSMYDVPSDILHEMESLLRALDRNIGRAR